MHFFLKPSYFVRKLDDQEENISNQCYEKILWFYAIFSL